MPRYARAASANGYITRQEDRVCVQRDVHGRSRERPLTNGERDVAVITDSAASLPPDALVTFDIRVVPMTVAVAGRVYADGELAPGDIVSRTADDRVTTSAPSPGAFLDVLEELRGRPVLVTTVARGMSASYESAVTAASYASDGRVVVVDTETAAGGQGLVVLAAARAANTGGTLGEVASVARNVVGRVHLLAFLRQLDSLARSGRVPGIAARAGSSLGIHAMFEFSHGRVRHRRPARSADGAVARFVAACRAGTAPGAHLHAAVLNAASDRAADSLVAALHDLEPDAEVYSAPFSSVMVAHTGPGLGGLAWWWEPPGQSVRDEA